MEEAADAEEFERAALFRDRLAAVRSLMERQRVAGERVGTADLIGVAVEGADANAQVFQVRDGILAERQGFYLDNQGERDEARSPSSSSPSTTRRRRRCRGWSSSGPALRERTGLLAEALERSAAAPRSRCASPSAASKRRLRELAERNAPLALAQDRLRRERRRQQRVDALAALQEALGLERLPVRIEGFDVSNLGPEHTVASMVVFEGGAPKKAHYRRFKIRGDTARAAARRLRVDRGGARRGARAPLFEQADLSPHDAERDESFASLPDLIVIDGGKGQLSAGMRALAPLAERGTTVIGARQAARGGLRPGPLDAAGDPARLRGLEAAAAGARRGAPLRDRRTTAAAATRR